MSSASLYGGTYNQLHYTFPKLGMEVSFIDDPDDLDAWRAAVRPNTRAFYGESIGNPKGDVFDFEGVAGVAHDNSIPLVIDNTLASPYLCRPLEHGADIVVHSATKFIGGHGTSIGGIIVDGGKFDYVGQRPLRQLHRARPELPRRWCSRSSPSRCGPRSTSSRRGCSTSATSGPRSRRSTRSCSCRASRRCRLRMERHSQNALAVAQWLEARDEVEWVIYPGLASSPWNERAKKYLPNGQGAIVSFGIEGGLEAGQKFVDSLELFSHLANVGDVRSLAIHPATTTHQQLVADEQATTGVTPDLVRLSVGHRVDRRHPRRPRRRLPRREGCVTATTSDGLAAGHRRVAAGRRSRPPAVRAASPTA